MSARTIAMTSSAVQWGFEATARNTASLWAVTCTPRALINSANRLTTEIIVLNNLIQSTPWADWPVADRQLSGFLLHTLLRGELSFVRASAGFRRLGTGHPEPCWVLRTIGRQAAPSALEHPVATNGVTPLSGSTSGRAVPGSLKRRSSGHPGLALGKALGSPGSGVVVVTGTVWLSVGDPGESGAGRSGSWPSVRSGVPARAGWGESASAAVEDHPAL